MFWSGLRIFRCVRQERISLRGSVRLSVRPSVRPSVGPLVRLSVRPLRLCKNRNIRLFLATVRSYTETNDQPTCFESLFSRLFVHLSLHTYVTGSIHAETQPGRIVARSGLFFDVCQSCCDRHQLMINHFVIL